MTRSNQAVAMQMNAGFFDRSWRAGLVVVAAMLVWLSAGSAFAAADTALPPAHQVVQKATREVLDRIVRDRPLFKKDPEQLYVIVEENLVPYVDFDRIAKRVMAKHFQSATPEQQVRFRDAFKKSLIRAYGSALANYNDQRFVVLPPKRGEVEADRASVNMEVTMSDGTLYKINYAMFVDAKGAWKLENLILEGINLGLTYRNNFAELFQQHGGDIDKVINGWSSKVEAERKKSG